MGLRLRLGKLIKEIASRFMLFGAGIFVFQQPPDGDDEKLISMRKLLVLKTINNFAVGANLDFR